jgi:hypothetical protein
MTKQLMAAVAGMAMTIAATATATSPAFAAEAPAHEPAPHLAYDHPTIPAEASWSGAITLLILGMFLMAAGVGVVVRLNAPEEVPPAHSHDEPPGTSHHHGPGGTVHPGPEHDLPGGHGH